MQDSNKLGQEDLISKLDKDREWLLKNIDQGKWPEMRNDLAKLERELSKLILLAKAYYSEK